MTHLFRLRPAEIWRYLHTQPASFWWLNVYMFFEYVRPQQLWPIIDVFPWAFAALLLTCLSFLLDSGFPRVPSLVNKWLVAFMVLVIASMQSAVFPDESTTHFTQIFNWLLLYYLIINIVTTEKRFLVFMLAFAMYNMQMTFGAMKQWALAGFGFQTWGVSGGEGWFANSGDFGVALCIFLPVSLYFFLGLRPYLTTRWKFVVIAALPTTALFSIVASSSRGAVLGAAAVALYLLMQTRQRVRGLVATAFTAAIVWAALPPQQKARFSTAGEDKTSVSRLTFWHDGKTIAAQHPLRGIGYYNWLEYYKTRYGTKVWPHNSFVLAMAELGYPGLLCFIGLLGSGFVVNYRTRRLSFEYPGAARFTFLMAKGFDAATIGFAVSGFFDTVLYYPFIYVNLASAVALHSIVRQGVMHTRSASRPITAARRVGRLAQPPAA